MYLCEGINASELFAFLNNNNVLVRYWPKEPIDDWLRISIGTDEETDRLLSVIDLALDAVH